jgi:hypothetical protein
MRAQYSMEFMMFFTLVSIVFAVWMGIYNDLSEGAFRQRDIKAIEDVGKAIQTHLFLASNMHTGYTSNALIIPNEAGPVDFEISTSNYEFYISVDNQDFVFTTPYIIGKLKKGENTIWNVNGVVAVHNVTPIIRSDGNVNFTRCSDFLDNDNDALNDSDDSGCLDTGIYIWQDDDEATSGCQGDYCP